MWGLATGQVHQSPEGPADWVRSVAFSPDGKTALSGSDDKTLKLWDLATGQVIASFFGESDILSVSVSPCGKIVLAGDGAGRLNFFRIEGGE